MPETVPISAAKPDVLDVRNVSHRYGEKLVLDDLSLSCQEGTVHALLGPNGAGKTTLIRILAGLLHPSSGSVEVAGLDPISDGKAFRQRVGFVPSGDRTFYLRISALENLVFFARLHGMKRSDALRRSCEVLSDVGLSDASSLRVGEFSHGMQKRLSVARALLMSPPVLLVDEATHDLDPEGSRRIRELTTDAATRGALIVWATQRLDEIRGFAQTVTLLDAGTVRFSGSVPELIAHGARRRFLLQLTNGAGTLSEHVLATALRENASITRVGDEGTEHYLLTLEEGVVLSDVLVALAAVDVKVVSCSDERSEIEEAFLLLTRPNSR
jgi:ABC-2 type transport system ATP-binding protein